MGTLDINALWQTHGANVTIGGQPIVTAGGGGGGGDSMSAGTPGLGSGETLDFDALLQDEMYRGEAARAL
jgi:hypothetical protein